MDNIIFKLFEFSKQIRYVALYHDRELVYRQKAIVDTTASSGETDYFEEILVNPCLLLLTSQRGNIDCGGLEYILVKYGHFYQFVTSIPNGHLSIGLEKATDINSMPKAILQFLNQQFPRIFERL